MTPARVFFLTFCCALPLSVVLLVAVILPAEFSLDPLGTGRALGLMGLSDGGAEAVVQEERAHSVDRIEFEFLPFESVEYSYRMNAGSTLIFSWAASDEVVFNLHSSPDQRPNGAPSSYAESFSAGRAKEQSGSYTATFNGRHGWFWENRTSNVVSMTLVVAGFVQEPLRSSVSGQESSSLEPVL